MRRLPPLNAIKAFESSARLVSFTKAGQELNVTHGAISRQVALLESWLCVVLFERTRSHLVLTEAGKKFYGEISAALDRIALAAVNLAEDADQALLTVSAPPTFTLRWLIPRLSTFQRNHLGVNVKLSASLLPVDFSREKCDIAIRAAAEPLPGVLSRSFLTEKIIPVCHPDLLEKHPLSVPSDLCHYKRLSYSTEPYRWQDWLNTVGAPDVEPAAVLHFEQMYFTLQAALEGLGIALIPYFLVADEIAAGRLCAPFGSLGMRERHYYAYRNPTVFVSPAQEAFFNWLEQAGCGTMLLCDQLMMQDDVAR
jgi:LysR family glycine cleavage system transcriptional activator